MVFLLQRTRVVRAALDGYLRKDRCPAEQEREQYTHNARASCHSESPIRAGSLPRACGRGAGSPKIVTQLSAFAKRTAPGLTPFCCLRILSPCEPAQHGAAVVVAARRRLGSRKFSGPTRRNAGGFLVFAQGSSRKCNRVGSTNPAKPGNDFIRRNYEHSNIDTGHIQHSAH